MDNRARPAPIRYPGFVNIGPNLSGCTNRRPDPTHSVGPRLEWRAPGILGPLLQTRECASLLPIWPAEVENSGSIAHTLSVAGTRMGENRKGLVVMHMRRDETRPMAVSSRARRDRGQSRIVWKRLETSHERLETFILIATKEKREKKKMFSLPDPHQLQLPLDPLSIDTCLRLFFLL
jgi:hypothetical protein